MIALPFGFLALTIGLSARQQYDDLERSVHSQNLQNNRRLENLAEQLGCTRIYDPPKNWAIWTDWQCQ